MREKEYRKGTLETPRIHSYFIVLPNRHILSTFEYIQANINSNSRSCRSRYLSGTSTYYEYDVIQLGLAWFIKICFNTVDFIIKEIVFQNTA